MTVTSLSAIHSANRPGVPISSAVGTCNCAPRNNGVNTARVSVLGRNQYELTIPLNRIMGDPTQHREL